jgi:hypothetical protein
MKRVVFGFGIFMTGIWLWYAEEPAFALSPTYTLSSSGYSGSSWYERYYRNYDNYKKRSVSNTAPYRRSIYRSYNTRKYYYNPSASNPSRTAEVTFAGNVTPTAVSGLVKVEEMIKVMDVSVHHKTFRTDRKFVEAGNLDFIEFQLIDGGRVSQARNLWDFSVILRASEGQEFSGKFDRSGRVKIYPKGTRIAAGEGTSFEVFLRLDSSASFGNGGGFRLKLVQAHILGESSRQMHQIKFSGRSIGDWVSFGRYYSGNEDFSSDTHFSVSPVYHIEGGILESGSRNLVAAVKLESDYEDIIISGLTIRNVYGSEADNAIIMTQLVDLSAGQKILDETRMLNGEARFDLGSDIYVYRGSERVLGIFVQTASDLSRLQSARLKIDFGSDDIAARGLQSGRILPTGFKVVRIDSKDFSFARSGGFSLEHSTEKDVFAPGGGFSPVYRFFLINSGNTPLSIGRLSFDVVIGGMDWDGGLLDAGDVKLSRRGFRSQIFSPSTSGNGRLIFDAPEPFYLEPGARQEMILQLSLEDLPKDDDWVRVSVVSDTSFVKSTLSGLRNSGAHFIWSDHSARLHSTLSDDWLSGFGVDLPLDSFINRR